MPAAAQIPLSMLLVFAAAKLLAEIFERLGQPSIVGEILAGVLIGPHVLGWLAPTDSLRTLSDLGVIFLLFRVGLEVKASKLMKVGGTALLVAIGGVVLPFFAGWGICALWHQPRIESVFIGAAMVATSVGNSTLLVRFARPDGTARQPDHPGRSGDRRCARPDCARPGQWHGKGRRELSGNCAHRGARHGVHRDRCALRHGLCGEATSARSLLDMRMPRKCESGASP